MNENLPPNEQPACRSLSNGTLWGGIALIVVGGVLLMDNMGISIRLPFLRFNWWAAIILVLAVAILSRAINMLNAAHAQGQPLSRYGRNQLVIGAVLLMLSIVFLFNLPWNMLWPAFLILGGLIILFTAR